MQKDWIKSNLEGLIMENHQIWHFFQILIMVLKHNIMREILSMLSCLLILLYKYRAIQAWKGRKSSLKSSQKALQKALQKLFKKLSRNQRIGASHISRFRSLSIDIKPQTILLKSSGVLQGPRAIHHTPSTPPFDNTGLVKF